ncbi:hypothetical protein THAOC_24801 [Thalassiosira oceanica]|uniref:Uncharacterized protein n=1 Tax=Thalassiosira oceanica TaxID=159749 RepID=K0RSW6_THAOC|nr:hypothetical protein THAOC_24801 [Thalassiosira oceanica]|eukprot:EJK55469.1 hypothetical protein THAOC_24801 [Thalassiosira oceanica]
MFSEGRDKIETKRTCYAPGRWVCCWVPRIESGTQANGRNTNSAVSETRTPRYLRAAKPTSNKFAHIDRIKRPADFVTSIDTMGSSLVATPILGEPRSITRLLNIRYHAMWRVLIFLSSSPICRLAGESQSGGHNHVINNTGLLFQGRLSSAGAATPSSFVPASPIEASSLFKSPSSSHQRKTASWHDNSHIVFAFDFAGHHIIGIKTAQTLKGLGESPSTWPSRCEYDKIDLQKTFPSKTFPLSDELPSSGVKTRWLYDKIITVQQGQVLSMIVSATLAEAVHQLDMALSQLKRLGIKDVSRVLPHVLSSPSSYGQENKSDHATYGSAQNLRAAVWDDSANPGELGNKGRVEPVEESAENYADAAEAGIKLTDTGKENQGYHLFRSKQPGKSKRMRRSIHQPILSTFVLLFGMLGILPYCGLFPRIFAMADTLAPKPSTDLAPIEDWRMEEEMGTLEELSRNLRGGTDPSEIIPGLHGIVKSQLITMQRMYEMYQNGEESALASSLKSLVLGASEVSDGGSKELKSVTVDNEPSSGLVLTDGEANHDLKTIPDSEIIEYFNPSFLHEVVEQLQSLDELLGNVKSILQEPQSSFSVPPKEHDGPDIDGPTHHRRRLDESTMMKEGFDTLNLDGQGETESNHHRRRLIVSADLPILPPVCTDECAPTDTSCLCQRLANCTRMMTNYDLSVLFANGYIESDSSSSNYGGLSVGASELNMFNVEGDAYNTFNSIMITAASIDESSTPEDCTAFLEQFHQSCDPLSSSGSSSSGSTSSASSAPTCSSANVESFQLSVDEVCENVHSPTKLLLSAIGSVFDGYASDNGKTQFINLPIIYYLH